MAISQPIYSTLDLSLQAVPIEVIDTWEIDFASEVQDIACLRDTWNLALRSNGDGRIYLTDDQCNYIGEIILPDSADGFGLAYDHIGETYYINSLSEQIYYSDGSDSWASFPHAYNGAGMDFLDFFAADIFEVSPLSPHTLCCINTTTHEFEYCDLTGTGVEDEITGMTVGMMLTVDDWPCALMATTRDEGQFLFFYPESSGYSLYEVEDCPLPEVEESLGLSRSPDCMLIYWSYKGNDGKYYVSLLYIEFFYHGGVEDEACSMENTSYLSIESNPAVCAATLRLQLPSRETATLAVYDSSGRMVEELCSGIVEPGESQLSFDAPAGMYTAMLTYGDETEVLKFVITE